jgi:hypothetical protein
VSVRNCDRKRKCTTRKYWHATPLRFGRSYTRRRALCNSDVDETKKRRRLSARDACAAAADAEHACLHKKTSFNSRQFLIRSSET